MGGTLIKGVPKAIPWRAVKAWADYHDLSRAEMALLDRCIVAMDAAYISVWSKKLKESLGK